VSFRTTNPFQVHTYFSLAVVVEEDATVNRNENISKIKDTELPLLTVSAESSL
jgi:hypothetical protein